MKEELRSSKVINFGQFYECAKLMIFLKFLPAFIEFNLAFLLSSPVYHVLAFFSFSWVSGLNTKRSHWEARWMEFFFFDVTSSAADKRKSRSTFTSLSLFSPPQLDRVFRLYLSTVELEIFQSCAALSARLLHLDVNWQSKRERVERKKRKKMLEFFVG